MTHPSRLVLGTILLLSLVRPALGMIFLVTDTYDATDANPGDGLCADVGGRCTLRAAVLESNVLNGPHFIVLPEGTYTLSIPGNAEHAAATGDLDLLAPITIRGQGPDRTVIDAAGIDRAFEAIFAGAVTIKDLTIENGVAGANTPGYFAAYSGGAIAVVGNTSTLALRNVVLRNNQAQSGGGLYNVFSTVAIHDSTLHENIATSGSGGGIAEGLAAVTRLYNVTLSGNRAAQNGGGMVTSNNTPLLYNVTVTGNQADSDANGSGNGGGIAQGITGPTLYNSIIAGNSDGGGEAPDCAGSITSNGYNLIGNDTGCSVLPAAGDQVGTAAMPLDPGLQALAVAETGLPVHALDQTSLAVDTGNPAVPGSGGDACRGNDARGANRTLAMPCDIGAYEVATFGQTFSVNSLNDAVDANPGNGICETAAGNHECTLRAAIQEANALFGTDTLVVPAGTLVLTLAGAGENLSVSGDLDITDGIRIQGAGMDQTIIDGGGLDRVFHLSTTAQIEMQGLTIRNGMASGASGGGILLENTGGLDLTDVRVTGNSAQSGGGVYAALWSWMGDGLINITRCIISDNTASLQGGGFANFTFRTSRFVDSTLSGNSAQYGGGFFNSFMSMALVTGSTISGNQAQYGGGITMHYGSGVVTLVNSTVSGNTATLAGGGINVPSTETVNLFSSTVTANRAAGAAEGGGVYSIGRVFLANTVLAGNLDSGVMAPDCAATLTSLGHNLIGNDAGCTFAATGGDLVGTSLAPIDPRLDALGSHGGVLAYHLPFDDSPVFDAGNSEQPGSGGASCPGTDQRGVDRRLNAPCDIGAIERRNADLGLTATVTPLNVVRAGQFSYLVQVTNAGPDVAEGLTLTLTPPVGSQYGSATGVGWTCMANGTDIFCQGADLSGGLSSDLTLTLVAPDSSGALASTLNVTTASWDANTADNRVQLVHASGAPPTITGLSDASLPGTSDGVAITAGLSVADVDSPMLASATVRFASGFVADADLLRLPTDGGLTVSWDEVNGVLTISGMAPLSTYQAVLRDVRYTNQTGMGAETLRYLEFTVSDGVFESDVVGMLLTIVPTYADAGTDTGTEPDTGAEVRGSEPDDSATPAIGGGVGNMSDGSAALAEADEDTASPDGPDAQAHPEVEESAEQPAPMRLDRPVPKEPASVDDMAPGYDAASVQPGHAMPNSRIAHPSQRSAVSTTPDSRNILNRVPETSAIASAEFWNDIAAMSEQMAAAESAAVSQQHQVMLYTAKTMSVFLFAGATNWYLKGSSLLASLLSSMPLWTPFDPLPILALSRRMKRRRQRTQAAAAALEVRHSAGMVQLLDAQAANQRVNT